MQHPTFSIIIPIYNVEKYLTQCIESILNQTFTDWECILVNDGSTDGSGNICDNFVANDDRIKVIHKKNEGVSVARNIGIEVSKGEYIIFVDSDDWVDIDFLHVLNECIQDTDILFYGNKYHYENKNIVIHMPHAITCYQKEYIEREILQLKYNRENYEYYGYTWDKVFKRDIIETHNIRFVPHLSLREDELFTSEYCRHIETLRVLSKPIYNYRVLNTGLTSKNRNYDEIKKYRQVLSSQIECWSSEELQKYETLRYAMFLNKEAAQEKNIIECIKKTCKAYSIVRDNYDEKYAQRMGKMMKLPIGIGIIANLYKSYKYKY